MNTNLFYKILLMCGAYFISISNLIIVILLFIAIDFLTGIYASYRVKDKIVSHRLRKTVEKFVFYTIAVLLAHVFQLEMLPSVQLTQVVAGFIASIELLSIYENIKRITGLDLSNKLKEILANIIKTKTKK